MELLGYGYAAAVTIGGIIGYVKKGAIKFLTRLFRGEPLMRVWMPIIWELGLAKKNSWELGFFP